MAKLEQTEGVVLNAEIGSGQSRYRSESGSYYYRTSYFPNITYQYTVNGQQYTNNAYAQRPSMINRKFLIQRILNKYPVGETVTVHYKPDDPQQSYLQTGYGNTVTLMVLAFIAIIIIAIVLLFFVL